MAALSESISAEERTREARAALTGQPYAVAFHASVLLAAAPVLLKERVEVVEERPHGLARIGSVSSAANAQSWIQVASACQDFAAMPTATRQTVVHVAHQAGPARA